jgi:biotin operon repressor
MSWMNEAWRIFRVTPRPVSSRDVSDRTGMSENEAQKCICRLRKAGCIELSHGSARTGRYYRPIPGRAPPQDSRGKHPNTKAALRRVYEARRRAARPVSHITAARPKL